MTATLWLDTAREETIELGGTLEAYRAFAEMARAAGQDYLTAYPTLFAVMAAVETQEDADPVWLAGVRTEARGFLSRYRATLSDAARATLAALADARDDWAAAVHFAERDDRAARRLLLLADALGPAAPEGLRAFASDWTQEKGPRGGTRWKNSKTGRVVYGKKPPGGAGGKQEDEKPAAPAQQPAEATPPAPAPAPGGKAGKGKAPPAPAPQAPHAHLFDPGRPPLMVGAVTGTSAEQAAWARPMRRLLDKHVADGLSVPAADMKAAVGDPKRFDSLVRKGFLVPNHAGTHVQATSAFYQQVDKLAEGQAASPGRPVRPPQGRAEAQTLARDYQAMPPEHQAQVRDYLGLTPLEGKNAVTVHTAILDRLEEIHNPVPVETRIAQHKELQKTLTQVGKIRRGVEERRQAAQYAGQALEGARPAYREAREKYDALARTDPKAAKAMRRETFGAVEKEYNRLEKEAGYLKNKADTEAVFAAEKVHALLQVPAAERSQVRYGNVPFAEGTPAHAAAAGGSEWLQGMLARGGAGGGVQLKTVKLKDITPGGLLAAGASETRANYSVEEHEVRATDSDGSNIHVHELGHAVEAHMPGVKGAVRDFLKGRVAGEPFRRMQDVSPKSGYRADEMGRKDHFEASMGRDSSAYYTGKVYDDGCTEVLSMGVQKMFEDPVAFAAADPEFFALVHGVLSGKLRNKPIPP